MTPTKPLGTRLRCPVCHRETLWTYEGGWGYLCFCYALADAEGRREYVRWVEARTYARQTTEAGEERR